jgi:beta-galactosidase
MLEHKHFITQSFQRFQRMQIEALRPHIREGVWITHNFMGWFDGFDHYPLADELDIASWDCYVGVGHHDRFSTGAMHDLVRGFKRKNFWVMETQPGHVNWAPVNNMLHKGETRAMAWHAVAHGADGILYWQWRSAPGGQEQYHGTLLDASGQPRLIYEEIKQFGKELKENSFIAGSKIPTRVAILFDYDSLWSLKWQAHHEDFNYIQHLIHYYKPLAKRNIPIDIISADSPLTGYSLVIAPALAIINQNRIENLTAFVKKGGKLLITLRTGVKDQYNALLPMRPPGPLVDLTGIEVTEYFALQEPVPVKGNLFTGQSSIWAEALKRKGNLTTEVAKFGLGSGWLENQIAVSVNVLGGGLIYYIGAYLDEVSQEHFLDRVLLMSAVKSPLASNPGVEISKRVMEGGKEVYILINHENVENKVIFPFPALDHITGMAGSGEFRMKPYGVAVMTLIESKK